MTQDRGTILAIIRSRWADLPISLRFGSRPGRDSFKSNESEPVVPLADVAVTP